MGPLFVSSRESFSIYKSLIKEKTDLLKENPYLGHKFKGNRGKGYRHIRVGANGPRIIYVICREARALVQHHWKQAKKRNDRIFHACKYLCGAKCVQISENTVIVLKIVSHQEQDRLFN